MEPKRRALAAANAELAAAQDKLAVIKRKVAVCPRSQWAVAAGRRGERTCDAVC